ncbi:serine hydrolase domain-containing protein [Carboxylicivirga taeanensis]|uniref:serine hydrolase domain-containing protein n=1 Tax=Carboxylicivirga taeanensis TaxID=1416875 RepID=UPI003F6DA8FF
MKRILSILLLFLSITSFGQADITHKIDSLLKVKIESQFAPGITVGIVKCDKLIYHNSAGCMNLEYNIPFNDSTVFGLASVTKQFTSACIGVLEAQGKLSVDDDVRKYIPELSQHSDTIRIKHLLNHTSGIRNHNVLLDLKGFDYEHQGYTNKMIQDLMFQQKGINNRPGAKVLYSNTNYVLLALLVERISGQELHEFANEELFTPLGMEESFYRNDLRAIIKNRAYPYFKENGTYRQPKSLTLCVGAGEMGSTIKNLSIWSQIFLNPQHEFSYLKDFVTHQDTLNNGELMSHARGMFVSPYNGYTTYNHSGRGLGMRSQFICVPELNIAVVAYTNSEHINAVYTSYEILDLFIDKSENIKIEKESKQPIKQNLKKFVGTYQELNSDLKMSIFIENDTLKAISSFGSNSTPLTPQSINEFCRINNSSVTYSFQLPKTSDIDLQVDFGGAIFYFERIKLCKKPDYNLAQYVGNYYSKELDVTYKLSVSDNQLFLNYPNNNDIILHEGEKNVFGANRRTKYSFLKNKKGEVTSFKVAAEGTVKNILFEKKN